MTLLAARKTLTEQLTPAHGEREAAQIALLWMEKTTGWPAAQQWLNREQDLTTAQKQFFDAGAQALLAGKPLQYVTGEAWFHGHRFVVDPSVLIPRPETEELVDWILDSQDPAQALEVLEVGTGSGCIAISLQLARPHWTVQALDVSSAALSVARNNAQQLGAGVHFAEANFLDPQQWPTQKKFHCLVSNPPYIPFSESQDMAPHVKEQEPHLALFVPDQDPLVFYKALAQYGQRQLHPSGALYVEVHEKHGPATVALMQKFFEKVSLRQDLQGRDRMVKASGAKAPSITAVEQPSQA